MHSASECIYGSSNLNDFLLVLSLDSKPLSECDSVLHGRRMHILQGAELLQLLSNSFKGHQMCSTRHLCVSMAVYEHFIS